MDKEASTIRLTYFTAQETVPEYLRAHPHPLSLARSTIAETRPSYLDSQQVKPVPLLISNAHPFSASNVPSFSISNTHRVPIQARRDLSNCAKFLTLTTATTIYPLKLSLKRRDRMFTLMISISFPCSMIYTTHYLRDC